MADVSTWDDFVSKYTDSSVSEINITSDLTVPAEGITSDIRVDGDKTINGGNHFIYNIAGTADHIFNTENHTHYTHVLGPDCPAYILDLSTVSYVPNP